MANDIDLGKISITPRGDWNNKTEVEYNDIYNSYKSYFNQTNKGTYSITGYIGTNFRLKEKARISRQSTMAFPAAKKNGFNR